MGNPPMLSVLYDLQISPVTFDFATFLALADCERQKRGLFDLAVTINTRPFRLQSPRDIATPVAEKRWRIANILLPLTQLIPTVKAVTVADDVCRGEFDWPPPGLTAYVCRHALPYVEAGCDMRRFTAPDHARKLVTSRSHVTLTIRNSAHFDSRNTDNREWRLFAEYLTARGYGVHVIPDVENLNAAAAFGRFVTPISTLAATNLQIRMALYEHAIANITASTGPSALLTYSKAPWLQFDQTRGGVFKSEDWERMYAVKAGEQYAWCGGNQRMAWKDSTFENLVSEWEQYAERNIQRGGKCA